MDRLVTGRDRRFYPPFLKYGDWAEYEYNITSYPQVWNICPRPPDVLPDTVHHPDHLPDKSHAGFPFLLKKLLKII